jgi:iron complex transport system permease protein
MSLRDAAVSISARPADPPPTSFPRHVRVLTTLAALAMASAAVFLTWGVNGHWDYALPRRAEQVIALAVVGAAIAVSTVIFQTLTTNRILTPSIMGFDALYALFATTLVFVFGATTIDTLNPWVMFSATTVLLMVAATALYRWMIGDGSRGLYTLVLMGVIAGTLFTSIQNVMVRVMDPNEYDTLLNQLLPSFGALDTKVLTLAAWVMVAGTVVAYRAAPTLDVLALGRERAIGLGVNYRRCVTWLLVLVALLVAVATALVGPVTFLGLLVANLAYQVTRSNRHVITMSAAILLAVIALVLGQALLQHVLHFNATLGSIINLVGGVYFIVLILKESRS